MDDKVMKPGKLIHIDDNKWYGDHMGACYSLASRDCPFQRNSLASLMSSLDLSYPLSFLLRLVIVPFDQEFSLHHGYNWFIFLFGFKYQ